MHPFEELCAFLRTLTPGVLLNEAASHAEGLLESCWTQLDGSDKGGMKPEKLSQRTEQMRWEPPELYFVIERHGAIVGGGSGRAELQSWTVNVEAGTARVGEAGYRRVRPADARLDVSALAVHVATHIVEQRQASFLRWRDDNIVRVIISAVISSSNSQTQAGRAKRFRMALDEQLLHDGWLRKVAGSQLVYQRAT